MIHRRSNATTVGGTHHVEGWRGEPPTDHDRSVAAHQVSASCPCGDSGPSNSTPSHRKSSRVSMTFDSPWVGVHGAEHHLVTSPVSGLDDVLHHFGVKTVAYVRHYTDQVRAARGHQSCGAVDPVAQLLRGGEYPPAGLLARPGCAAGIPAKPKPWTRRHGRRRPAWWADPPSGSPWPPQLLALVLGICRAGLDKPSDGDHSN